MALPLSPPTCDYCGGRKFRRSEPYCDTCKRLGVPPEPKPVEQENKRSAMSDKHRMKQIVRYIIKNNGMVSDSFLNAHFYTFRDLVAEGWIVAKHETLSATCYKVTPLGMKQQGD